MNILRQLFAKVAVGGLLSLVIVLHYCFQLFRRPHTGNSKGKARVLMIGTFHSLGWFMAHVAPLAQCAGVEEVLVLCDAPLATPFDNVCFQCPSPRLVSLLGRPLARVCMLCKVAVVNRPHIYMGYHIMPNALLAVLFARVFGGKALYQMTGGPLQVIGGGYQSENPLLAAIQTPSQILEKLMFAAVRCFDMVVVRGNSARRYVEDNGLAQHCIIITGAIDTERITVADTPRDIAAVYVGRLVDDKGVEECITVAYELGQINPTSIIGIVGSGLREKKYKIMAKESDAARYLHFLGQLEDVRPALNRSKLFLLLSPSEGMSIAMLEAMAAGLPVVVNNVGDLRDAFTQREVGILVNDLDHREIAKGINELLHNDVQRAIYSANARKTIVEEFSIDAMAKRWEKAITALGR